MAEMLRLSDVTLTEESEQIQGDGVVLRYSVNWLAEIDGRVYPSTDVYSQPFVSGGVRVQMSRAGKTAQKAMDALRTAIELEGWELR